MNAMIIAYIIAHLTTPDIQPKGQTIMHQQAPPQLVDTLRSASSLLNEYSYQEVCLRIKKSKNSLKETVKSADTLYEMGRALFLQSMTRDILPAWYGTAWDFNGYTPIPKKGHIACGYFVSTPLFQIGLNINRYRIAQQAASPIIHILCGKNNCFTTQSIDVAENRLSQKQDGLYICGLSNHVGFLLFEKGQLWFIHSNYHDKMVVIKELAASSPAILDSDIFVIGSLSNNPEFIRSWIHNKPFIVP